MKIILRITAILITAALVGAGFYLAVNNSGAASGAISGEGDRPAFNTSQASGTFQPGQPPASFEGGERGERGGSLEGLLGVFGTLARLGAITAVVLLAEKGVGLLKNRRSAVNKPA